MSRFFINNEMFGKYAKISTNYNNEEFIYKVISLFESNTYQDVPIKCGDQPTVHDKVIPVLNVVKCGIDESKVIRVALKDCLMVGCISTNEAKRNLREGHVSDIYKYCPNCGARMDEETER